MTVVGDARRLPFADGVAQCVVTSPPYYGLRDYGIGGQIGLEQTPAAYVAELVAVFREVWRVLRDDGVAWLNIGDSYASATKGSGGGWALDPKNYVSQSAAYGARRFSHDVKDKDLLGIPWRVAFALQDDGWYLRSDCIWHKPNPMPESVTDRPTKAHEYVFLLSKSARYYYDAAAVAEAQVKGAAGSSFVTGKTGVNGNGRVSKLPREYDDTRNARTVWTIATRPYSGAHFATMPPALAQKCILAGTSERGACPKCGAAWVREVDKTSSGRKDNGEGDNFTDFGMYSGRAGVSSSVTTCWRPACDCNAGEPVPCVVLDPFSGAGTTERVAIENGRRFIGTELNPKYVALRSERVAEVPVRML